MRLSFVLLRLRNIWPNANSGGKHKLSQNLYEPCNYSKFWILIRQCKCRAVWFTWCQVNSYNILDFNDNGKTNTIFSECFVSSLINLNIMETMLESEDCNSQQWNGKEITRNKQNAKDKKEEHILINTGGVTKLRQ